ncbi:MAG: chemotaxis protein CheD [Cyanobacteria bacterium P01_H01_bin.74]
MNASENQVEEISSQELLTTQEAVTEMIDLGDLKISNKASDVFCTSQLGTGVALILFDARNRIGGITHIALPDSNIADTPSSDDQPGKYANLAIPKLVEQFNERGGETMTTSVKLVGGAQLFNFGGGGGNILNIGARNATAIRAALFKIGLVIEKSDTGGNKNKVVYFKLASGQVIVNPVGGDAYEI